MSSQPTVSLSSCKRVLSANRLRDRKSTRLNSSHTVIYTLSLHDALPISHLMGEGERSPSCGHVQPADSLALILQAGLVSEPAQRSEEHTSELQSHRDLHSFPTRRSSDLPSDGRGRTFAVLRPCPASRQSRSHPASGSCQRTGS